MAGEILDNNGRGDAAWGWPAIHPEGRKFGAIAVLASLVFLLALDWEIIGWPLLLLSLGVFAFFRDPERVVPQDDSFIVAPADGLVTLIQAVEPPVELQIDDGKGCTGSVTRRSREYRSSCRCSMSTSIAPRWAARCGGWSISPENS